MSGGDLQKSADKAKYKKDSGSQHPPGSLQKILPFWQVLDASIYRLTTFLDLPRHFVSEGLPL
jgi:hypothetical protein